MVIVLGAGIPDVFTEIIILACFGLVMLLIAIPAFNRIVTRVLLSYGVVCFNTLSKRFRTEAYGGSQLYC